ncbi:hypothetical protein HK104_008168 [Borealophlyctis nickersoniae]|nr:hypothetical protein HK104_008168 [Borealophlyctis nickersoniae]
MAQNGTNWKNVNNWHWVEKNCFPWAKKYVADQLVNQSAEDAGTKVSISELASMGGDVNINQRKGKIITVYDVEFSLKWTGEDANGNKASGKIVVPELMHDTEPEEIVFDISLDTETKENEKIKQVVRNSLLPVLRKQLSTFSKDMIENNGKDVYIAPQEMKGHPVLKPYQPKPPTAAALTGAAPKAVLGGTTTINQKIEFVASGRDIYETLLDAQRVRAWTRGKAEIAREVGGTFNLFDGNITGTIVELVPNKKIVQKWRLRTWPNNHHSTVTLDLEEGSDSTILRLTQEEVPIGEKEITEGNWQNYYWNSIKGAFGYGALL